MHVCIHASSVHVWSFVRVCMPTCMQAYVDMHIGAYKCRDTREHAYLHTSAYKHTNIQTDKHANKQACTRKNMPARGNTCTRPPTGAREVASADVRPQGLPREDLRPGLLRRPPRHPGLLSGGAARGNRDLTADPAAIGPGDKKAQKTSARAYAYAYAYAYAHAYAHAYAYDYKYEGHAFANDYVFDFMPACEFVHGCAHDVHACKCTSVSPTWIVARSLHRGFSRPTRIGSS